jgi:hypothetical protein
MSLVGVMPRSCDFIFSFDSLVQVNNDVMSSYLNEIYRVLNNEGVAFLHHSNLTACNLERIDNSHLRYATVSAEIVRKMAADADLKVATQELVPWDQQHFDAKEFTDAFTALIKTDQEQPFRLIENCTLPQEKAASNWLSGNY